MQVINVDALSHYKKGSIENGFDIFHSEFIVHAVGITKGGAHRWGRKIMVWLHKEERCATEKFHPIIHPI